MKEKPRRSGAESRWAHASQLTSSRRVAPEIKAAVEKAAAGRTLANWVELVLAQELRKQGYLKK